MQRQHWLSNFYFSWFLSLMSLVITIANFKMKIVVMLITAVCTFITYSIIYVIIVAWLYLLPKIFNSYQAIFKFLRISTYIITFVTMVVTVALDFWSMNVNHNYLWLGIINIACYVLSFISCVGWLHIRLQKVTSSRNEIKKA